MKGLSMARRRKEVRNILIVIVLSVILATALAFYAERLVSSRAHYDAPNTCTYGKC